MDPVFVEETENLKRVENRLDQIISSYEARKAALQKELSGFVSYDYEDRTRYIEMRKDLQSEERYADQYRAYKPSPYFARMDLDTEIDGTDDIETKVIFIGKEGIHQGTESLVIDWRSDVGQYYYMKSERSFKINGYAYQLALRRAINIDGGKLLSYNTEYDSANVTLEGDIVDPFLLTVLKDKRRHNRLTDIIRTIQANQNDIIRRPRQESFVVQGCAGSGKTMILLHRLSFLLFNNRNLSPASIKIITPNKFFDAHINELSHELGLDQITRYTVEEYYVELIHRFSSRIEVEASVNSEKDLSVPLLESVYSPEYADRFAQHYHDYWNEITKKLSELGLPSIFEQYKRIYPDVSVHQSATCATLENSLREIQRDIERRRDEKKRLSERLAAIHEQLVPEQEAYSQVSAQISGEKEKAIKSLNEELAAAELLAAEYRQKYREEKKKQQTIASELEQASNEKEALTKQIEALSQNATRYQNLDDAISINDDISHQLLALTTDIRLELEKAKKTFEDTPFYSFGRRNAARRQIEELEKSYAERVQTLISEIDNQSKEQLQAAEQRMLAKQEEASKSNKYEKELVEAGKNAVARRNAASACIALFSDHEYPDVVALLSKQDYSAVAPIVYGYVSVLPTYLESTRRIENLKKSADACEQETTRFSLPITDKEASALPECVSLVSQLRFSDISRNVLFKDLLAEYRAFQQPYRKDNYRHKLYLRLLLCSYYFPIRNSGDTFVNIDEAQDISIPEYRLLRRILGTNCVFNLYGDVNQLVYSYKGISDWDEIIDITKENIYALNENYRNTIQITEFCNKEFHAEVYPIGISGEPVQVENLSLAVQEMLTLKAESPEMRIAVIYRHGRNRVLEKLQEIIPHGMASWGRVDDKLISVISVETAKGLEFDAVLVVTDSMTENEKYIAFTRALDRLVVVTDDFPKEEIQVGISDEVEEELRLPVQEVIVKNSEVNVPSDPAPQQEQADEEAGKQVDEHEYIQPTSAYDEIKYLISEAFQEEFELNDQQMALLGCLEAGDNVACTAPSGWAKSILLYAVAAKNHREGKGQTLLTAEGHLQENELVLADRLGLKAGILNGSIQAFDRDFKKDKYDVIFVPYDYFVEQGNSDDLSRYFNGKIAYWGVDHPSAEVAIWHVIQKCAAALKSPLYLMSKEGFPGIELTGFKQIAVEAEEMRRAKKIHFLDGSQRIDWFNENKDLLYGQGIVYCNSDEDCKKIARVLRKAKINAQAYLDSGDSELINYLTNSFSNGGLPVLVTTQQFGKNLTNPRIRFIVHYDVPEEKALYELHRGQIGKLAESTEVYDLELV